MSHLRKRLALLKLPPFRLYSLNCFLSMLGVGLNYIAMAWMIVRSGKGVGAVAILMFCFWFPGVIISPLAGAIVDHYPRQKIIFISNLVRGLTFVSFGWYLEKHFSVMAIYTMSLISGACFSFYGPAAMRIVREIVTEKDLFYANATIDMIYEVGNAIGMGAAGFLISLFSAPFVTVLNGIFFLLAAATTLKISSSQLNVVRSTVALSHNIFNNIKDGLRYLLDAKVLMAIYTIQLLLLVEVMITPVLLAPFAKNVLHASAAQFGDIEASLSIGIIVGGLFVPWLVDYFGLMRTLFMLIIILGMCYILFSLNHYIHPAEILYFIIGFALAVWPIIVTKAQEKTAIEYQGRVQAAYNSVNNLLMIMAYLILKTFGHYFQVASLYWVEIIFTILILGLLWKNRKII